MRIPDKDTFKRLSAQLAFGNRLRQFDSFQELITDCLGCAFVTVRSNRADSPCFVPSMRVMDALMQYTYDSPVYFQELPHRPGCTGDGCDGCGRLINFEACRMAGGLAVKYAHHPSLNLRHDLEQNGREATGLQGLLLLRHWLAEDFEVLEQIWDLYPDAVIEATRFSVPVGVLDSHLIVWEVRNY